MQLIVETVDIHKAIEELERALPITALTRVIEFREQQHRPRGHLRRRLQMLRAIQLAEEVA